MKAKVLAEVVLVGIPRQNGRRALSQLVVGLSVAGKDRWEELAGCA